jgi:RHS repeat-associated protein
LHRDAQGSVRALTTAAGLEAENTLYRPYGEETIDVYDLTTAPETKGYIGERFDADAGLQFLNARYYDPKLGMFLQPDWWEVAQAGVGTNRYSYAGGDPVNGTDASGHSWYNDWKDFKDLFKGSNTTNKDGHREIQSAPILRAFVPGQTNWDNARTSWTNGNRVNALLHSGAMFGETVLAAGTMGVGGAASKAATQVAKRVGPTVIERAKLNQLGSGYAPDLWKATRLKAGDKVLGGLPGQSAYYTNQKALDAAKGSSSRFWESLQVRSHSELGYRTSVGVYEVISDTTVASGRALANGDLGVGGALQHFIPDFSESLKLIGRITLGE